MKTAGRKMSWSAAACALLWSCSGDPLLGENRCYGEGVVCKSEAPTLTGWGVAGSPVPGSTFDVVAARTVTPTWVYDFPCEFPCSTLPQVASTHNGGVWAAFFGGSSSTSELQRIDAEGQLVESHPFANYGTLSVDEELNPVVLGWWTGQLSHFSVNAQGEPVQRIVRDLEPNGPGYRVFAAGRGASVLEGRFQEQGSYIAEYGLQGELRWKQTELRDARDFPFEDLGVGMSPLVSYGLVALSDGAIAVGVPKFTEGVPGLAPSRTQGVTLLEADGNLRWDAFLEASPSTVLMSAAPDGGLVVTGLGNFSSSDRPAVRVFDRHGDLLALWMGMRVGYHDAHIWALCTDPAGDIYTFVVTGERDAPTATVCRMSTSEPNAEVVCLGVDGGLHLSHPALNLNLRVGMAAPQAGSVVLSFEENDQDNDIGASRLVRIDF
jgi:hypothetical protein